MSLLIRKSWCQFGYIVLLPSVMFLSGCKIVGNPPLFSERSPELKIIDAPRPPEALPGTTPDCPDCLTKRVLRERIAWRTHCPRLLR